MRIPVAYRISDTLSDTDLPRVLNALAITPVAGVLITRYQDAALASQISPRVVFINAIPEFPEGSEPVAVIVEQQTPLTAIYAGGTEESVAI
jgi:hypothetical protein